MKQKISDIRLSIDLDDNRVPEKIHWSAEGVSDEEARAFFLSIWDHKSKETLRIDLWTKDMSVDEMKLFFHQTLFTMADTFMKATNDEKMYLTMKDFCDYFAEKMELK
ncbi:MAG: gliding motility protein GldC [Capnocytophaga sp.]|nr:gliding motility protein GldC [Capnocytophaga sp.]